MGEQDYKNFKDIPIEDVNDNCLYDESYIDVLAEFIQYCETPMTIALQGEWGSGKTSMMKMLNDKLKGNEKILYVDCNAWLFSQLNVGDRLPFILYGYLVNKIGKNSEKSKELLSIARKITTNIGKSVVNYFGEKYLSNDKIVDNITESIFTKDALEELDNIQKNFNTLVKDRLRDEKKERLVIFIDDIDRLDPVKAVELLSSIKVFCESENSIFILAVDYEVIKKGADKKYEEKGEQFFDKIIQVPFNMPIESSNIEKYIEKTMKSIPIDASSEKNLKEYASLSIDSVGRNPRSIKRLIGAFCINTRVAIKQNICSAENNENNEQIMLILFCLLCMQQKERKLYADILENAARIQENGLEDYISAVENFKQSYPEAYKIIDTYIKAISSVEEKKLSEIFKISNVTSIKTKSSDEKIGTYVRTKVKKMFEDDLVTEDEINKLLKEDYSKLTFGLNFPFLCKDKQSTQIKGRSRYYKDPVKANGNYYYITSEWFQSQMEQLKHWVEKVESKKNN